MAPPSPPPRGLPPRTSVAFLLAQVGAAAAERFGERSAAIDVTRPQAGLLRALATHGPMSQQALAAWLDVVPSRLVALVDDLEQRGALERRQDPSDRRLYAVTLTKAGRDLVERIGRIAREHDQAFCAPLGEAERAELGALLQKLAEAHGLRTGVHPGFRKLGEAKGKGTRGR
jgi:DNA-binding MarR family transcriptional regulator